MTRRVNGLVDIVRGVKMACLLLCAEGICEKLKFEYCLLEKAGVWSSVGDSEGRCGLVVVERASPSKSVRSGYVAETLRGYASSVTTFLFKTLRWNLS